MKHPTICWLSILFAAVAALTLRLPRLQQRPMHGDEAVHAFKFGRLLEEGYYRYDPNEYHGPTLNYLTLIPAWLSGITTYKDLSEFTLRIVPVVFGVLLVVLVWLVADGLGKSAAIAAAIATAISPAFVFYSRYYIHEVLLAFFTFGVIASGYRYLKSRNIAWALLAGVFLGLCHATKETCIIAFASMISAVLLTLLLRRIQDGDVAKAKKPIDPLHVLAGLIAAAVVSALLYSSFLTNVDGVLESVRTYANYLHRASQNNLHIHPWYYYLQMLVYWKHRFGPVWSEVFIVILAAIGFIAALMKKGPAGADSTLLRFVAFYTLTMTAVYSAIPYKTPWCMLSFLQGMILLAGVGAMVVLALAPNALARVITVLLLLASGAFLIRQAYQANYELCAHPWNPYVYAHTLPEVVTVAERVDEISEVHPDGSDMYIQVICPDNYWPLPWYLRRFPNVGWWRQLDEQVPLAPLVIIGAGIQKDLIKRLSEIDTAYVPLLRAYQLRPGVLLRGYVTKDLWDRYEQHQAELVISQSKKGQE